MSPDKLLISWPGGSMWWPATAPCVSGRELLAASGQRSMRSQRARRTGQSPDRARSWRRTGETAAVRRGAVAPAGVGYVPMRHAPRDPRSLRPATHLQACGEGQHAVGHAAGEVQLVADAAHDEAGVRAA